MKKILFISYGYFDANTADTIQNRRIIYELRKYYDIDIICRSKTKDQDNVYTQNFVDLSIIDRILYKLFPFLRPIISFDMYIWSILTYHKIKYKKYDYIINVHEPYAIRELGFKLKNKYNAKLITLLYDPCYENAFFCQSKIAYRLRRYMERIICLNSDVVFVNNSIVFNKIKTRYPNLNICEVPLCCEENLLPNKITTNFFNKYTIIHAGNIHGGRSYKELVESVKLAKQIKPDLSEHLQILLFGQATVEENSRIEKFECSDVLKVMGSIETQKLNNILINSDALLLIDPVIGFNYSFPSKLCDYFALEKPIIAFSSPESVSFQLLKDGNHIVCTAGETLYMANEILRLVREGRNKKVEWNRYSQRFKPSIVVKQYVSIINNL